MIKSTDLKSLLQYLLKSHKESHDWIESLPREIQSVFYENTYVNNILLDHDRLLKFAVGDLYEDIQWFLYDWKPGYEIQVNETKYVIKTLDDYIDYLETNGLIEK